MSATISTNTIVSAILFLLLCTGCQRSSRFYFVRNQGAIMPVKIRGNVKSNKYVVLLPGGPSGDGLIYSQVFPNFTNPIEKHFKMVYYDQRGAGNCQGLYETSSLNFRQLCDNLFKVIKTIKSEDPVAQIFLLGHSFGGTLATNYLIDLYNAEDIDGYISISGAYDRKLQEQNQQRMIEYLLDKWVDEGVLTDYEALKDGFSCKESNNFAQCQIDSIETMRTVNLKLEGVEKYNRFKVSIGSVLQLLGFAFFSQSNPIQSGITEGQNGKYFREEFDNQLLSQEVGSVQIPTLLINGRYDTNVLFFEAEDVFKNLGTPLEDKKLVILEESGHLPMVTEPRNLAEEIIAFINQN